MSIEYESKHVKKTAAPIQREMLRSPNGATLCRCTGPSPAAKIVSPDYSAADPVIPKSVGVDTV
jgi:hypothetical protein